jgi:hypothetical protein
MPLTYMGLLLIPLGGSDHHHRISLTTGGRRGMNVERAEELVPRGFLSRLLAEFGVEWTNFVLVVGVLISSFSLDRYLNAGIWTFGAIASFSIVYLLRRSIDGRFPYYFMWAATFILLVTIAIFIASLNARSIGILFQQYRNLSTLLLSIAITVPVAECIISYRKQEEEGFLDLPKELQELIQASVLESPFYNRGVEFVVEFAEPSDGLVRVTFEVTLLPFNRSKRVQRFQDVVDPAGSNNTNQYAMVDGVSINTDDPDYKSDRGFTLVRYMDPGQEIHWTVKVTSTFYQRDSEFFGSYFPSTSLLVLVKAPPTALRVSFISFLHKKVDPKQLPNGDLIFEWRDGILPFQGLRLLWEPR